MYPINLFLDDKPCLVIGGGTVAAGKIKGLLAAHGNVTVIAPHFCRAVLSYGTHAQVTLKERPYEKETKKAIFSSSAVLMTVPSTKEPPRKLFPGNNS